MLWRHCRFREKWLKKGSRETAEWHGAKGTLFCTALSSGKFWGLISEERLFPFRFCAISDAVKVDESKTEERGFLLHFDAVLIDARCNRYDDCLVGIIIWILKKFWTNLAEKSDPQAERFSRNWTLDDAFYERLLSHLLFAKAFSKTSRFHAFPREINYVKS